MEEVERDRMWSCDTDAGQATSLLLELSSGAHAILASTVSQPGPSQLLARPKAVGILHFNLTTTVFPFLLISVCPLEGKPSWLPILSTPA
jgi:hypothetical protein